jgi:hypothetical protein
VPFVDETIIRERDEVPDSGKLGNLLREDKFEMLGHVLDLWMREQCHFMPGINATKRGFSHEVKNEGNELCHTQISEAQPLPDSQPWESDRKGRCQPLNAGRTRFLRVGPTRRVGDFDSGITEENLEKKVYMCLGLGAIEFGTGCDPSTPHRFSRRGRQFQHEPGLRPMAVHRWPNLLAIALPTVLRSIWSPDSGLGEVKSVLVFTYVCFSF